MIYFIFKVQPDIIIQYIIKVLETIELSLLDMKVSNLRLLI